MKKLTLSMKALVAAGVALLAVACAQGFDDKETFQSVTNEQLESPAQESVTIEPIANADGTESIVFSWRVVPGAGGYVVSVYEMDGDASEVRATPNVVNVLIDKQEVDGCSVTFPKNDDTYYLITVLTLGNDKLNNKEALSPLNYAYTTWAPMQTLPTGSDLAEVITLIEPEDPDLGQGFALVAGGKYTMSASIDFGLYNVTLKGDEANPPTVEVLNDAMLITQAGLKIKNINFDCTAATGTSLLACSAEPDESLSTESLGYKADGANQNGYVIEKPVIFDGCMVKNLPKSLIWGQKKPWSLRDFRITNCIIQLNNASSATFIDFSSANPNNGLIKEMTIRNSTIYNLVKNGSAYFIRYSNSSNSQPKKIFGNSQDSSVHRIEDCTIAKTFTGKDFGNGTAQYNKCVQYVSNVVFYDVFRLYQFLHNNNIRHTTNNTMWYFDASPQDNDTGGRKDSDGNPFTTLEDPGFTEPFAELDLTKPNGGVNFKASGAISSTIGDPRWR